MWWYVCVQPTVIKVARVLLSLFREALLMLPKGNNNPPTIYNIRYLLPHSAQRNYIICVEMAQERQRENEIFRMSLFYTVEV